MLNELSKPTSRAIATTRQSRVFATPRPVVAEIVIASPTFTSSRLACCSNSKIVFG
jgi:hypothetical protein